MAEEEKKSSEDNIEEEILDVKPEEEQEEQEEEKHEEKGRTERRIQTLLAQRRAAFDDRDRAQGELTSLREEVEALKKDYSSKEESALSKYEEGAQATLDSAKREMALAYENSDFTKVADAQETIADAKFALREAERAKREREQPKAEVTKGPVYPTQSRANPRAVVWAEQNKSWWGKDTIMTGAAYIIDNELISDGFDPGSDEHYEEIDKRLREEFPKKFERSSPPPRRSRRWKRKVESSPNSPYSK